MEDENTFKDIYETVLGIGKAWDDVNDIDKAALLEALAGKQQSNSLAAALSNTGILEKSYKEAMQSAGSAMREQEKYQEKFGLMPGVVAAATAFLGRGKLEQQFCPVWG